MKNLRKRAKLVSVLLTLLLIMMTVPYQAVFAEMIGTERVISQVNGQKARDYLNQILVRKDVQSSLISYGIDPMEAKARIDSLSDAEVQKLYSHFKNLPAGGSDFGVIIGALLVVFVVLLVTDILGYTNVFTFVKHRN
ncbi:MAG: PA2779 family protein [Desulfobacterales bacterium]